MFVGFWCDRRSGPVALFPGGPQGDGVGEYVAELLELRSGLLCAGAA
jgi:hypothetical protein